MTVVEYIQYALEADELQLRSPLHRQILTEALEHYREEGFRCDRYFENHPDIAVSNLANELAHDPETLSKIHSKGAVVKPEEERLLELVPHVMTDYKLAIVDESLRNIMLELRKPETMADKELSTSLLKRYQEMKQVQKDLGKQCGDRVIQ